LAIYAGDEEALKNLERCRINPDFTQTLRNDLEFYIPQLCSFLFDPNCTQEVSDEVFNFLMVACSINFFFSHRVWFFMQGQLSDKTLAPQIQNK
jgi:hypothetical protein